MIFGSDNLICSFLFTTLKWTVSRADSQVSSNAFSYELWIKPMPNECFYSYCHYWSKQEEICLLTQTRYIWWVRIFPTPSSLLFLFLKYLTVSDSRMKNAWWVAWSSLQWKAAIFVELSHHCCDTIKFIAPMYFQTKAKAESNHCGLNTWYSQISW